jgi:hypothetical protein
MALDACFTVAVFLFGAASGALLTRISYTVWEDRMHREVNPEPSVRSQNESLRSQTTESRVVAFFGQLSSPCSPWRKLARHWLHSNLGE